MKEKGPSAPTSSRDDAFTPTTSVASTMCNSPVDALTQASKFKQGQKSLEGTKVARAEELEGLPALQRVR